MEKKKAYRAERRDSVMQMIRVGVMFAMIVGIGVFAFLKYYNAYMDKLLYAERLKQMQEVTGQLFAGLQDVINGQWEDTEKYCNYVENDSFSDFQQILTFLKNLDAMNGMVEKNSYMVAVDSMGRYYTRNGCEGTLRGMQDYPKKPPHISFVLKTRSDDDAKMYFLIRLAQPITVQRGTETITLEYYGAARNMQRLNPYFNCEAYNGNNSVYFISETGERVFSSANATMFSRYNVYGVLQGMEYLHGSSFDKAKKELEENGIVYSNVVFHGKEYYYSMYEMDNADWNLLFLVDSDYVAVNTVRMIHTTVRMVLIFAVSMVLAGGVLIYLLLQFKQKQAIEVEQKNNEVLAQMNQKLSEAVKTAEEANHAKSDFLANMSHDIRTPMNAIVGITMLMEHEEGLSDQLHNYIHKVQISSRHLLGLINDILDMSKIESKEVKLNLESVCLTEQIGQVDSIIRSQTKEKGQKFELCVQELTHTYVICDGVRLRQILLNLLSNAVKYTPNEGRIVFEVSEHPCETSGYASYRFVVEDTGYGMTKEFVQHIFEPFTRAENSVTNKIQGTGLGMAITKNIVDLMGGTICVKSKKEQGSRFEVTLNLKIDQVREKRAQKKCEALSLEEKSTKGDFLKGKCFLCAEDNLLNAEILESILQMYGASCTIYHNGAELTDTFSEVSEGQYDAILMDVQMPVMNGLEAASAIRNGANPLGKTIPIIAMTANAFSEDVLQCLEAGMDAHLAKPMDISKLEDILRAL